MAISVKSLNNGQPRDNPYGKVTSIPPSFSGVDYYDCYVPYALTNQQLGGYSTQNIVDAGVTYPPMPDAIKRQRVANHPASRGTYVYSTIPSVSYETDTKCAISTKADRNGISTKFYLTAVQPFFLRRSVGTGTPTDGYFGYSTANRGQLIDVILTNGKCIHVVLNDVNSVAHTNCGNNQAGTSQFASTNYNQYHNITSAVQGNTLELTHQGDAVTALNAFSNKYGIGTWGVNGTYDVAFYRVYNAKITTGFTLASPSYAGVAYDISSGSTPTTYTVTVQNDGHGTGSASPSSGVSGTTVTLSYSPNSGYRFKQWQVVSGGVTVSNNKFTIGSSNVVVKAIFELIPPSTYSVSVSTDGHGTAYATPTYGEAGTTITLYYQPNANYEFDSYEVISGGVVIYNNNFSIGNSNVSIKVHFKEKSMSYNIPRVPYFCQYLGVLNQDRTVSHDTEPAYGLGNNGANVANSGCGPCCAAMAMSYILNQDIVVSTICNKLGGYSSFMTSGVGNWNLGTTIGNAYGVSTKRTQDPDEALSALKQGNLVMIIVGGADVGALPNDDSGSTHTHWTRNGHYILAIGVNASGKIAVADPGNPKNSYWFYGVKRPQIPEDWSWNYGATVNWSQITKAARIPGNSNGDGKIATGGAFTIFYVPENRKSGSYTPSATSPDAGKYIKQERGIFGLNIDFDVWRAGTHLMRIGDYVVLKAKVKDGTRTVVWTDITDRSHPVEYTPAQLKSHFGISYTKVNNGYIGKFYVTQSPLEPKYGGTGVSSIEDLLAAVYGIDNAPSGYDYTQTPTSLERSSKKITLPNLAVGHITTAEARSSSRGGLGSSAVGDQAQSHKTKEWDDQGEVSLIYDRNVKEFTNVYRLVSNDPLISAKYKRFALSAANHAVFLANNAFAGYNYYTSGSDAMWRYVKQNLGSIEFGKMEPAMDTNCIILCKMAYGAVMYDKNTNGAYFDAGWTTHGILNSTTLEKIGFTKYGSSFAQNPKNLEIGDILIKDGHAALVADVGGKSWELNGVNYNPKNGEVIT